MLYIMDNLSESITAPGIFTPEALLEHWQGHRRVTRRMIEAFPEDKLFTYSIGAMRPFSDSCYGVYWNGGARY